MPITAHRRFIERDFLTTSFHQFRKLFPNHGNQRLGDVPTALVTPTRTDAPAQSVGSGNARFQYRPRRRNLLQALEFFHRSQPVCRPDLSRNLVFSPLVVRRRPEAARRSRTASNAFQSSVEREIEVIARLFAVGNHVQPGRHLVVYRHDDRVIPQFFDIGVAELLQVRRSKLQPSGKGIAAHHSRS